MRPVWNRDPVYQKKKKKKIKSKFIKFITFYNYIINIYKIKHFFRKVYDVLNSFIWVEREDLVI